MANNGPQGEGEPVYNVNVAGNSAYPRSSANSNIQNSNTTIQGQGREGQGVNNVNVGGNSANPGNRTYPNIQNRRNTMIQGRRQDQEQSRGPYGYNQAWYPRAPSNYTYPNQNSNTMIQGPGRQGQAVHNVNVAGNRTYPNIQNSNMMIQGQGQDQHQGRGPYGYNQAWYPGAPSNYTYPNQSSNTMIQGPGRQGQVVHNVNVAGNRPCPNSQNSNTMRQGRRQDQDQSRGPYGYNQAWYPRAPSNMLYVQQPNYTYPNPAPAMDMNMNMNSYNGGYYFNYYHHPPTDGRFHPSQPQPQLPVQLSQPWQPPQQLPVQPQQLQPQPQLPVQLPQPWQPQQQLPVQPQQLQPQPQLPVQPQPRPQPVFDAGRRGSSGRHSSGRNSNNLQAAGRGRGRVLMNNNYNIDTSLTHALDNNIGELLMRLIISQSERSIERQGQGQGHGHALEPNQHANADTVSREHLTKFFVIKSFSRENVVSSIKHTVWTSTSTGNRILSAAYASSPVFLFFSVQRSGNFCGVVEMDGPVDIHAFADSWNGYWKGKFPVKWHMIKDVPYNQFRHIRYNTPGNPDQISIVYCRDTQQVEFENGLEMLDIVEFQNGLEMLDIFKRYVSSTFLLDDASTSTASPQNSSDNQRWRIKKNQDREEQPVDAKQKGKEKEEGGEEGCEQYNSDNQDQDQEGEGKEEEDQNQEEQAEVEDKQKGKEKEVEDKQKGKEKEEGGEEGCEQYCIGSAICDIISTNQIKQQDTIEDSLSDMQLQEIVNTEEMQQGHVETNNEPPKATVDTHVTTQVTEANTGYTNQIMAPP